MGDIYNLIFTGIFAGIGIYMTIVYFNTKKYLMIKDQQWSGFRIIFLVLGVLSIVNFFSSDNTVLDYFRIIATLFCVSMLLAVHNGVGEEGIVAGLKYYKWSEVRGWDYEKKQNTTDIYFQVDNKNEKKKDEYNTKPVTFDKTNQEYALRFMKLNANGKYMRMKRRSK